MNGAIKTFNLNDDHSSWDWSLNSKLSDSNDSGNDSSMNL
jgi:hypothetical protein